MSCLALKRNWVAFLEPHRNCDQLQVGMQRTPSLLYAMVSHLYYLNKYNDIQVLTDDFKAHTHTHIIIFTE